MNTRAAVPPYMSKMSRTGPVTTERCIQSVSTRHSHTHQAAKQDSTATIQLRQGKNPELKRSFWVNRQIMCGWGPEMGLGRAVRVC